MGVDTTYNFPPLTELKHNQELRCAGYTTCPVKARCQHRIGKNKRQAIRSLIGQLPSKRAPEDRRELLDKIADKYTCHDHKLQKRLIADHWTYLDRSARVYSGLPDNLVELHLSTSEAARTKRHSMVAARFSAAQRHTGGLRRHSSQEVLAMTDHGGENRTQAVNDRLYTELRRQKTVADELRAENRDLRRAHACLLLFVMLSSISILLCLNAGLGYLRSFLWDWVRSLFHRAVPWTPHNH